MKQEYTHDEIREHRKQWLAALRSGKYMQIQESLSEKIMVDDQYTEEYGFCCMGVACEISGVERVVPLGDRVYYGTGDDASEICLPLETQRWLGVTHESPEVFLSALGCKASLDDMNDSLKMTFEQIADAIELEGFILIHDVLKGAVRHDH